MKKVLFITLISCFSLTIISCSDDKEEYSATGTTDTTAPTVTSVSTTADNQSSVSITDNITVTFSEAMDYTSITTNIDNSSCYGTLMVSSDNFSNCVQMASSPSSSNSDMTFTLDPSDNLTVGTTYLTRVTTGVKDSAGTLWVVSMLHQVGSRLYQHIIGNSSPGRLTAITSLMALMNSFHQMLEALSWKMRMITAVPPSCPLEI